MRNRVNLKGTKIYVDNDLTRRERNSQEDLATSEGRRSKGIQGKERLHEANCGWKKREME